MHCAECRHWHVEDSNNYYSPTNWNCWKDTGASLGLCSKAENSVGHMDDIGTNPLMRAVCASESIYGELVTRGDFGCLLFEAKP